jgi:hypothetical protein
MKFFLLLITTVSLGGLGQFASASTYSDTENFQTIGSGAYLYFDTIDINSPTNYNVFWGTNRQGYSSALVGGNAFDLTYDFKVSATSVYDFSFNVGSFKPVTFDLYDGSTLIKAETAVGSENLILSDLLKVSDQYRLVVSGAGNQSTEGTLTAVPLPGTVGLFVAGLAALLVFRRWKTPAGTGSRRGLPGDI